MVESKMMIILTCNDASKEELISQLPRIQDMVEKGFDEGEILLDMNTHKVGLWRVTYKGKEDNG